MDLSTYLPILLALGLIIIPELSGKGNCNTSTSCCSSNTQCSCNTGRPQSGCTLPGCTDERPVGCENGGSAVSKRCGDGNIDLCGVKFKCSPEEFCPCKLRELQDLAENGYETWRLDPASAAAHFMQSCFIDEEFRAVPSYLAGQCRTCDKTYVVLGVRCAGKMIFELCQPVKQGNCGIWVVTRYGKYC